ncbi:MAG: hypothetical protein H6545_03070 [Bacteroidales bacterium]|nr:hypothetical protein [Bacteroidales bacterium]
MATLVRKLLRVLTRSLITAATATATHLITIDDNVNPTLIAPASLTAVCDISEQPAYTTYAEFTAAGGTASDNCGIDEGSFTLLSEVSDGNTCPEVITRTYQIADHCGNSATATQLITIDDNVNPTHCSGIF